MTLPDSAYAELLEAQRLLENPGFAVKVANVVGIPVEKGFGLLSPEQRKKVGELTSDALHFALRGAVWTMKAQEGDAYPGLHKLAAAASGAAGGAFGLPALVLELPVSTAIILRSIADIARANGESLDTESARLACLEVFAFGGSSRSDDAADSSYFGVRTTLAKAVTEAAQHMATGSAARESTPALVRLISQIAARFQIQVSEKVAAQAVPVLGAAGGALVNLLFIDHFQNMSRGHFTVRRLERAYGGVNVRDAYERLALEIK